VLGVARKVFQDFAHVLCQRFVEVPSNRDLVNLVLLGGGTLVLDLVTRKAMCNRYAIEPLPYAEDARSWLDSQMVKRRIPIEELIGASLTVEYDVEFRPEFECSSAEREIQLFLHWIACISKSPIHIHSECAERVGTIHGLEEVHRQLSRGRRRVDRQ
jgi:hypothetical protein